jgi:alpha-L-rhamnosidase
MTDPILVANAFLIQSLDIMVQIAHTLHKTEDELYYQQQATAARVEFSNEYISKNGRMVSDSQTAYALAICFDLLDDANQTTRAGDRLAEIVRKNSFKIGTGFAGTPFICKALVKAGHSNVAYAMLLNTKCPSWLFPVTMGATTMWERWDSMRPDHSINPGDMTSFNHYAFGAVGSFLFEHVAGLQRASPGWKRSRVAPVLGGELTSAKADHLTPYGRVASAWALEEGESGVCQFTVHVVVPPGTQMEVVLPAIEGDRVEVVGSGEWSFKCPYKRQYTWPVEEISFVSM